MKCNAVKSFGLSIDKNKINQNSFVLSPNSHQIADKYYPLYELYPNQTKPTKNVHYTPTERMQKYWTPIKSHFQRKYISGTRSFYRRRNCPEISIEHRVRARARAEVLTLRKGRMYKTPRRPYKGKTRAPCRRPAEGAFR